MADEKKKTCFIIMPLTTPPEFEDEYRDGADHFRHVLDCLFIPAVDKAGFKEISPVAEGAGIIPAEIIENLEQADLVLCDMSCLNPNVFFEFGIRTALNKPVCVVKDGLARKIPFDTAGLNYQEYDPAIEPWNLPGQIEKLAKHLKKSDGNSNGENKLWKYFGIRAAARPYGGETGPEAKIDLIATKVDSLQRSIDQAVLAPPVNPDLEHAAVSRAWQTPSYSPSRQALESSIAFQLHNWGAQLDHIDKRKGECHVYYGGALSGVQKQWIADQVYSEYGRKQAIKLSRRPEEGVLYNETSQGIDDQS